MNNPTCVSLDLVGYLFLRVPPPPAYEDEEEHHGHQSHHRSQGCRGDHARVRRLWGNGHRNPISDGALECSWRSSPRLPFCKTVDLHRVRVSSTTIFKIFPILFLSYHTESAGSWCILTRVRNWTLNFNSGSIRLLKGYFTDLH